MLKTSTANHPVSILRIGGIGLALIVCYAINSIAQEDIGIYDDRVIFGQSAAFSGPAQELGRNMNVGLNAAFTEVNRKGGVHGRRLELISRDDQYEPDQAVANTRQLIEAERVFGLIGAVGTPTSRAAIPVVNEYSVPYIAPFTGAGFLREGNPSVVNLRASYSQETEEIVSYLTEVMNVNRIAIVYQDDSYGKVGYQGALKAMTRRGLELVGAGVYPRNTLSVKTALLDVRRGNPGGLIIIGSYAPTAELIRWAKKLDMNIPFFTISFVGSNALALQLGSQGEGVYVSQVVPFPWGADFLVTANYRAALKRFMPEAGAGFVSFEGYLAGRMTAEILEKSGRELTRDSFLESMRESTELVIDGLTLHFGQSDNQGSNAVYLTRIDASGEYQPVTR